MRHSPIPLLVDSTSPTTTITTRLTTTATTTRNTPSSSSGGGSGVAAYPSLVFTDSAFSRSLSAPSPAPSAVSSSAAAPSVTRASSISPSLISREADYGSGGNSSGSSSRRGSGVVSTHSTPLASVSSSVAVPAVQRLLSIRSAYLSDAGLLSINADFASAPPSSSSLSLASQLPSASSPLSPASRLPRSLRLAFSAPELESAYQSDYSARYFHPLRRVVLACVAIWCLFVINDVWKWKEDRKTPEVTITLRFVVAAAVAATTLASYHPKVKQHIGPRVLRWTVAGYIILFGACQVAFGAIESNTSEPTYCDFIILLAAMSASLFRLPFFLSTACNVLLFVIFVVLSVSQPGLDHDGFYSAMVWLAVALVLFTFNGYLVERSMRSTFFAAQQLAAEEANSQRVLATMLPVRVIAELRHTKLAFVYEHHRSVSVLFSHIHHFDQHTATLEATAVVGAAQRPLLALRPPHGHVRRVQGGDHRRRVPRQRRSARRTRASRLHLLSAGAGYDGGDQPSAGLTSAAAAHWSPQRRRHSGSGGYEVPALSADGRQRSTQPAACPPRVRPTRFRSAGPPSPFSAPTSSASTTASEQ